VPAASTLGATRSSFAMRGAQRGLNACPDMIDRRERSPSKGSRHAVCARSVTGAMFAHGTESVGDHRLARMPMRGLGSRASPSCFWGAALALAFSTLACSIDVRRLTVAESVDGGFSTLSLIAGSLHGGGHVDGVGTAARFDGPRALAADGNGNVYVADTGNCTIRQVVVATGQVTTLAGTPGSCSPVDGTGTKARFAAPGALAIDGSGNLYVADGETIRTVVVGSGEVTTLAGFADIAGLDTACDPGNAVFCGLSGLAVDTAGNLYASETTGNMIRKVVVATGEVTTLAGSGSPGSADGTGAAASFDGPGALAIDDAGNLYVADGNLAIRKIAVATGVVTTLGTVSSGLFGGAGFSLDAPGGLAVDGAGTLYAAAVGVIVKVIVATWEESALTGVSAASSEYPALSLTGLFFGLAADGPNNLYVADTSSDTIRRVGVATGMVTTLAGSDETLGGTDGTGATATFNQPNALVEDLAGSLYVADTNNQTIRQVNIETGATTTLAGSLGVSGAADGRGAEASFDQPSGLAIDREGNLYIADTGNCTIRKMVIPSAVVTTLAGSPSVPGSADGTGTGARFNKPTGLALDGAGNLFVADTANFTIRRVIVATGAVTTVAGSPGVLGYASGQGSDATFQNPTGLALDGAGGIYVADGTLIRKINVNTRVVSTSTNDFLDSVMLNGVAIDGAGHLFVADSGSSRIEQVEIQTSLVTTLVGPQGSDNADVLGALPAGLFSPKGLVIGSGGELFATSATAVLVIR
jgi:sugar lactone lactonase YvrE